MMIEQGIKAHLAANAALAAILSTRIYPLTRPQDDPLPALVYSKVSEVPEYHNEGHSGLVESRFQFSCLGETYAQTKALANAVKKAMRPLEKEPAIIGGASGVLVASAFIENEVDVFEPNDVEHESKFHIPIDYMIQYYEEDL